MAKRMVLDLMNGLGTNPSLIRANMKTTGGKLKAKAADNSSAPSAPATTVKPPSTETPEEKRKREIAEAEAKQDAWLKAQEAAESKPEEPEQIVGGEKNIEGARQQIRDEAANRRRQLELERQRRQQQLKSR